MKPLQLKQLENLDFDVKTSESRLLFVNKQYEKIAFNEVLEIERAKKKFCGGGLILGSSCGISKEVPIGKIRTLYPTWDSTQELQQ